jgi:hypothetical protein
MKKSFFFFVFICIPVITEAQIGQIKSPADSNRAQRSVSATGYYYFVPDAGNNTLTLIGYLDYKSVHMEPRYNYEGQNTGSLFAGYKFQAEGKLSLALTPMLGIVFGSLKGFAPGVELELSFKSFDFYTENEYVIDQDGSQYNYFYTWTELGYSPFEKFRAGISAQRTRLYETGLDIQRGVFAEYSFWKLTAGVHYFNPFTSDYFFIASLNFEL